ATAVGTRLVAFVERGPLAPIAIRTRIRLRRNQYSFGFARGSQTSTSRDRVKELDASLAFYTKVLGMKELGRNTIDVSKGFGASLRSEDGGFELELNYYE